MKGKNIAVRVMIKISGNEIRCESILSSGDELVVAEGATISDSIRAAAKKISGRIDAEGIIADVSGFFSPVSKKERIISF